MKNSKTSFVSIRKSVSLALVFTIIWSFCGVSGAIAGWDDQSDELPGMDNSLTPVLAIGGVLIAGLITWAIVKKDKDEGGGSQDNEKTEEKDAEKGSDLLDDSDVFSPTAFNTPETETGMTVQPLAGISGSGACVGVSLGF